MTPRQWAFYLESVPFTVDAIEGRTSLGGSESAAIGMMKALVKRGHEVQCFATRLERPGFYDGVIWHRAESDLGIAFSFMTPDVFVSLRLPTPYVQFRVPGNLNVLWAEDLLVDQSVTGTLSQVDEVWFVSEYHRKQWLDLEPMLASMAWVTQNGIDPELYPAQVYPGGASWRDGTQITRDPHRYIYISRPERALRPLLELWPQIRQRDPQATLGICRYQSMYDGEGTAVQQMVDGYDRMTQLVAQQVGGIVWLGQLGKRQLAEAIAGSRAMLYPGVKDFAETSGIAALEAQACGTPLIGSWRGALPETLHPDAGVLIDGDPATDTYQVDYMRAVDSIANLPDSGYQRLQDAGRRHVRDYAFDAIAARWEQHVEDTFRRRYEAHTPKVLTALLHWDRHVMARQVAEELGDADTVELCDLVIAGKHQVAEDYAQHAIQDAVKEARTNKRFREVVEFIKLYGKPDARILDVACGNGSLAIALAEAFPDATVIGVDYSPGVLALARAGVAQLGLESRVTFLEGTPDALPPGHFDVVTCCEFLEHVPQPATVLNQLEAVMAPTGIGVLTCPCGPFAELMPEPDKRKRGHLHTYSHQQLTRLFKERQWKLRHLGIGSSQTGAPIGYWLITWQPNPERPIAPLDCTADIVATRPYQQLTAILIVKDGEDWLRKCLKSIGCVDRILVHDTGSDDKSVELAREFYAEVVQTDWPDSFAEARNRVLRQAEAEGADWVLWIDCDEQLEHGERLRKYCTGAGPFAGYVLRQQHLMVDAPQFHDKPARLFRTGRGIRFYGAIHEQPETAPDAGVWPSLEIPDCEILHYGYHHDRERRKKLIQRNLPLLHKQLQAPESERRRLDFVLYIRDCANIAQFELEANQGQRTDKAMRHAEAGVGTYVQHFADPADKYHALARPFYETCLFVLQRGFEVGWGVAAGAPTLQGKLAPEKFRAQDADEAEREIAWRTQQVLKGLRPPSIQTLPCVGRTGHRLVE